LQQITEEKAYRECRWCRSGAAETVQILVILNGTWSLRNGRAVVSSKGLADKTLGQAARLPYRVFR